MAEYKIPNIVSIYPELNKISDEITISILLSPIDDINVIYNKVMAYEGFVTNYGYLIKIHKIIGVSNGIIMDNGNIKYDVCISCNIFKPSIGDIIIGCKLIAISEIGLSFKYNNIFILVETTKTKGYKINKLYNIEIKELIYGLYNPIYTIIYEISAKKYKSSKEAYFKKILSPKNWVTALDNKSSDEDLVCIDYYNNEHRIKLSDIIEIIDGYQIYIEGTVLNIFDIPHHLRFIKQHNKNTKIVVDLKFAKKIDYREDTYIKQFVDENLYGKYSNLWENEVKFLINPFEMLRPSHKFFKLNLRGRKFIQERIYVHIPNSISDNMFPISRAYFKVPEIMNIFLNDINHKSIFTLADAPGGWSQAFRYMFPKSKIITTSLKAGIPYNNNIKKLNVTIDYLKKGDGDLLNITNLQYMIEKYGKSMNIVASDGALEYGGSVPKEVQHTKLFIIECIITLLMQKKGGSAFIKMYKRWTNAMKGFIYLISSFYDTAYVYKPKSVRISNSETFLILKGFKDNIYINVLNLLKTILKEDKYISKICDYPEDFLNKYNEILDMLETELHKMGHEIINRYKFPIHNKNDYIEWQIKHIINNYDK